MVIKILSHHPLDESNTLGFPARAEAFVRVTDEDQLVAALDYADQHNHPVTLLGGGSNLVLCGDVPGLVIQMGILGRVQHEDTVILGAGENWHQAVVWSVETCALQGLEALALIPGTVGAAPVQNIGAYGVELHTLAPVVRAYDCETRCFRSWHADEAEYAYRDSRFKSERDRHVITEVRLSLARQSAVKPTYPDLCRVLGGDQAVDPKTLMQAVIQVRQQKLPDPEQIGNAGSFFKNPVISVEQRSSLVERYPELPSYPAVNGVKLSAAWMIEHCGWKGYTRGGVGVSPQHALVLVHYGNENGQALMRLAADIQQSVMDTFGVVLEPEPRVL